MPIFDYKCNVCNNQFDFIVLKDENPTCPNCNSLSVKRMFSGRVGIEFKAKDFYVNSDKEKKGREESVW